MATDKQSAFARRLLAGMNVDMDDAIAAKVQGIVAPLAMLRPLLTDPASVASREASYIIERLMEADRLVKASAKRDPQQVATIDALRQQIPALTARQASFAASLIEQFDRKGSLSDKQWACVADLKPVAPVTAAPAVEVTEGIYVSPSDGHVWKVYTTQNGRLGVMTPNPAILAANRKARAEGVKGARRKALQYISGGMRIVGERAAAHDLRPLTDEEAAAFGRTHATCVFCGLPLDDDRSVAAGYGPVCAGNKGLWYPSYEEAADILGRDVIPPQEGEAS